MLLCCAAPKELNYAETFILFLSQHGKSNHDFSAQIQLPPTQFCRTDLCLMTFK